MSQTVFLPSIPLCVSLCFEFAAVSERGCNDFLFARRIPGSVGCIGYAAGRSCDVVRRIFWKPLRSLSALEEVSAAVRTSFPQVDVEHGLGPVLRCDVQCLLADSAMSFEQAKLQSPVAARSKLFYYLVQCLAKWKRGLELLRSVSKRQGLSAAGYEVVRTLHQHTLSCQGWRRCM